MAYFPGHNYFLRVANGASTTINDTTGAISASTNIATANDIGYLSPSSVEVNEGIEIGYAAGRRTGSYDKRGARTITLSNDVRIGSSVFIAQNLVTTDALPWWDLYYGVSGLWARGIYRSRVSRIGLAFQEGGGQEIVATAAFEGTAYADASPVTLGYDYKQFGEALTWTDARTFSVNGIPMRDKWMGLSVEVDQQLERKGLRPDFGDNVPGSRTSYDLLPHHHAVTGSFQLHDLPTNEAALFTGSQRAMNWSNIVIQCNDVAANKIFDVTIVNPRPTGHTQDAVESAAQMSFTVPFVADRVEIATSR